MENQRQRSFDIGESMSLNFNSLNSGILLMNPSNKMMMENYNEPPSGLIG